MLSPDGNVVGATLRTDAAESRRMMRKEEFKAIEVACQGDVIAIGVLVDHNACVIAGDHHISQDGQCAVVARRCDQAGRAVCRPGGLHAIHAGIDNHVLDDALLNAAEVNAADRRIVIGADIQVPDDDAEEPVAQFQFDK